MNDVTANDDTLTTLRQGYPPCSICWEELRSISCYQTGDILNIDFHCTTGGYLTAESNMPGYPKLLKVLDVYVPMPTGWRDHLLAFSEGKHTGTILELYLRPEDPDPNPVDETLPIEAQIMQHAAKLKQESALPKPQPQPHSEPAPHPEQKAKPLTDEPKPAKAHLWIPAILILLSLVNVLGLFAADTTKTLAPIPASDVQELHDAAGKVTAYFVTQHRSWQSTLIPLIFCIDIMGMNFIMLLLLRTKDRAPSQRGSA